MGAQHDKSYIRFTIEAEAIRQGVSPSLALGVATIESSLNPEARGSKGEIGLFQVLPEHFKRKDISSPIGLADSIREGISQLKYWQTYCPVKEAYTFIICYNSGFRRPKHPLLHPYYLRVMEAMRELQ